MSINDLALRGLAPAVFGANEPVQVKWRPKAILPHAVVAQTVMLNPKEYDERAERNPKFLDYEISGKQDVAIQKGELAFEIVPPKLRVNLTTHTDVYVFTSASGLTAKEAMGRIRFVGQVAKGTDAQGDRDNAVSVQVGGPITTANTGREWIFAGNTVVAEWPEYLYKGGKKVPGIDVMGTPPTKFIFNLRPLRMNDVFVAFMELKRLAFKEATAMEGEMLTHDLIYSRIKHLADLYSHWRHVPDETQCPIYRFLHLVSDMYLAAIGGGVADYKPQHWCFGGNSEASVAHANAMSGILGKRKIEHRADSLSAEAVKRLRRSVHPGDSILPVQSAREIFDAATNPDATDAPLPNANQSANAGSLMFDAGLGLMMEQYNLSKRLVVGKALTSAGPGQVPLVLWCHASHSLVCPSAFGYSIGRHALERSTHLLSHWPQKGSNVLDDHFTEHVRHTDV